MKRAFACLACFVFLAVVPAAAALVLPKLPGEDASTVRLFVAYCPTDFTGAGAVVHVDARTGNWTIKTHVKFPGGVFGCVADYNPTYDFDARDPNTLWFDFTSDDGYLVGVDLTKGNITTINSADWFFTGFLNFKYFSKSNTLRGFTGTVTQQGFCSDGCIGFGYQDITNRKYKQLKVLPFKALGDDTSFLDHKTGIIYAQGSYDLSDTPCAPVSSDDCLLAVDVATGVLLNKTWTPKWYAYKYGRVMDAEGKVNAFMVGFNGFCNSSNSSTGTQYVFGKVDLATATATPHACVSESAVVIQEDEWVSSYSSDERLLATSSGNGDGDDPQFLVLNATSGAVVKQTRLSGLAKALKADMKLIFVWAVDFLDVAPQAKRRV